MDLGVAFSVSFPRLLGKEQLEELKVLVGVAPEAEQAPPTTGEGALLFLAGRAKPLNG